MFATLLAGSLALVLLAGAGLSWAEESLLFSPRFVLSDSVSFSPPDPESSDVYLIREQVVRVNPMPPERVYLDGVPATLLPQRTWCVLRIGPGRHRLAGILGCPDFVFESRAGYRYVVRLREIVDAQDQWSARPLFDSFTAGRLAIERGRLRHVATTEAGMTILRRAAHRAVGAAGTCDVTPNAVADTLEDMLLERPLDQVNLENDFFSLRGRLIVDSAGLHYRASGRVATTVFGNWRTVADSQEVALESVRQVRFGGVRFTGATPWVSIVFHSPDGLRMVSFGSFIEDDAVNAYNRLFAALVHRLPPLEDPRHLARGGVKRAPAGASR